MRDAQTRLPWIDAQPVISGAGQTVPSSSTAHQMVPLSFCRRSTNSIARSSVGHSSTRNSFAGLAWCRYHRPVAT